MVTLAIFLGGAVLLAMAFAREAGALHLPALRRRKPYANSHASADGDQCAATTSNGSRCTRARVNQRSQYCWQHQRMARAETRSAYAAPVQRLSVARKGVASRVVHVDGQERQRFDR